MIGEQKMLKTKLVRKISYKTDKKVLFLKILPSLIVLTIFLLQAAIGIADPTPIPPPPPSGN